MTVIEGMSDAFLALDADWRVVYANEQAARLNGTVPEALIGRDHWEVWPETLGSSVEREYRRAVREGVPIQLEHHYAKAGVWHDIRAYPGSDGGLAIFYHDISERKRLEAERARQARELADAHDKAIAAETQFRLLVDRVEDYAIFLMDPDGIVTQWGRGAQRIGGWSADEAIGMPMRCLYPNEASAEDGSADDHLRHAAAQGEYIGEGTRRRKDGESFPARVVLTALRRGGKLVGFSSITRDLSEDRRREETLTAALKAAQAASIAKSQFLANTSHEIRTPVNAVMGYAELLDLGLAGALTEQQRQYVARIQATSRHLLALVNDVLDLSRIEAGQMRAAREPGLIHDVIASALQLVEPQALARHLTLVNACTEQAAVAFRGDAERVRQILVNLLSNAVRFSEANGRVTVSCGSTDAPAPDAAVAREGRWTFVRVEDTGVGIAPDQLERIWEAFVQVDASRTRKFGGSGLGLTISRHLARAMGGDITVRSRPGLGSSFVVWLPAAEAVEVPPEERRRGRTGLDPEERRQDPEVALAEVGDREGAGLDAISDALHTEIERILAMYVARLRADPETPSAHGLGESQTEDHSVTFLADIGQCLAVVGQDGPDAVTILRDGSTIQRLIADRHGIQRAQLGWMEPELVREYQILREEVHTALRRRVTGASAADVERALAIINHLFEQAEREAIRSFRGASRSPDDR